jgi:hypothetical protein
MVFDAASGNYVGFSFQLNGYSLNNPNCAFQQYVISYVNGELTAVINNWDEKKNDPPIINEQEGMLSISGGLLPRMSVLTITLLYSADGTGTVTGAQFDYAPNSHAQPVTRILPINLPQSQMAPIVTFELNIVGINRESSVLTSGAGTIVYRATNGLNATTIGVPGFVEFRGFTAETANTFYGTLPSTSSNVFTQAFKIGFALP